MSGEEQGRGQPGVTIDMLPDDVLLEIFGFYRWVSLLGIIPPPLGVIPPPYIPWKWHELAHVSRRWRHIILASPRRLDLRVSCTPSTPTRNLLNIWPSFPISITAFFRLFSVSAEDEENIIAALGQRDRISEITLRGLTSTMLERFAAVMEEPLPALTFLELSTIDTMNVSLPEAFLGGSAPRLRSITLDGILFPMLLNLVLFARNLRSLSLRDIPYPGFMSPHAMVTSLSALPNLESLIMIGVSLSPGRPLQITAPTLTRAVLPALTNFVFDGVNGYLEDFVARVDTPLLNSLHLTLSSTVFDIPQLLKFIDRTERLKKLNQADVKLFPRGAWTVLRSSTGLSHGPKLVVAPTLSYQTWPAPCILPLLSQVERLDVVEGLEDRSKWQDRDHTDWLKLFNSFVSVKSLYVSEMLGPFVAQVLQELAGERIMEVLPALHDLFLEGLQPSGSLQEALKPFLAARQGSNHPVVIQHWDRMPKVKTAL